MVSGREGPSQIQPAGLRPPVPHPEANSHATHTPPPKSDTQGLP
jgi:hypothetical protein